MPSTLHPTLQSYLAATNRHDVDSMIAAFADDAVVKDERQDHRGASAIRGWMQDTILKYNFTVEPASVARSDDQTVVTVTVSGSFPGSPITLSYRFRIGASEKIERLEIN
jgi:ketosteroid isomerase-like protein